MRRRATITDPRHAHEFIPNRHGFCKQIVGNEHCGKGDLHPVHTRWELRKSIARRNAASGLYDDLRKGQMGMKIFFTWAAVVLLALIAAFLMLALIFNVMDKQKARQDRQELNEYWQKNRQWQRNYI